MITEENARAGHDAAAQMIKEKTKKFYSLVNNEHWLEAAELNSEIQVALIALNLSEGFLNA